MFHIRLNTEYLLWVFCSRFLRELMLGIITRVGTGGGSFENFHCKRGRIDCAR